MENQEMLTYQLKVAKEFGLKETESEFLKKITDWKTREWYLICIIDGMPLDDLLIMAKAAANIDKVKKARIETWRKKVSKTDQLNKSVLRLQEEVSTVCKESQEIKKVISENIEQAMQQQAKAQADTLAAKDEIISMLERKVATLEDNERLYRNSVQKKMDTGNENQPTKTFKGWFFSSKKVGDTNRFIKTYLKDDKYSSEQKNYLIECIEEGMSLKEIQAFASPNIDVITMKRLKDMVLKKRGE